MASGSGQAEPVRIRNPYWRNGIEIHANEPVRRSLRLLEEWRTIYKVHLEVAIDPIDSPISVVDTTIITCEVVIPDTRQLTARDISGRIHELSDLLVARRATLPRWLVSAVSSEIAMLRALLMTRSTQLSIESVLPSIELDGPSAIDVVPPG